MSEAFLTTPARRSRAVHAIADVVRSGRFPGLHLDFESPHTRYAGELVTFVAVLRSALPRAVIDLDVLRPTRRREPAGARRPCAVGASPSGPGPAVCPESQALDGPGELRVRRPKGSTHALTLPLSSLPAAAARAARYDPVSHEMAATYTLHGTTYVAWWESLQGIRAKVRLARSLGLGGVAVWRLGYDTPCLWQTIASA